MGGKDISITDTERLVLGALLLNPSTYWQVADTLRADHFVTAQHRALFAVIADLAMTSRKPALSVIAPKLAESEEGEIAVMADLSAMLRDADDLDAPALDFVPEIIEAYGRRRLKSLESQIAKQPKHKAVADIVAEVEEALLDLKSMATAIRPKHISEIARNVLSGAAAAFAADPDKVVGFDTGIAGIDEIMGRLMPGDYIAVMASRGDGKTSLGMQWAMRAGRRVPVLFCEIDMKAERMIERRMAGDADVSTSDIQLGNFDAFGYERIEQVAASYAKHNVYIYDAERTTIRDLRAQALIMQRTTGLGMVVIDHFRNLRVPPGALGRNASSYEVNEWKSGELKALSKELNVPLVCLVQRTYTAQRRKDPIPQVDDAGIPALDQDADVILAVWREATWMRQNKPDLRNEEDRDAWVRKLMEIKDQAKAICLKRRGGEAFKECLLKFDGERTQFLDV